MHSFLIKKGKKKDKEFLIDQSSAASVSASNVTDQLPYKYWVLLFFFRGGEEKRDPQIVVFTI